MADHQSHYRAERAAIDCSGVYSSPVGFRTFDGTCNNLQNKAYGSANTINQRFLPADYSDGSTIDGFSLGNKLVHSFDKKIRCRCSTIRTVCPRHIQRSVAKREPAKLYQHSSCDASWTICRSWFGIHSHIWYLTNKMIFHHFWNNEWCYFFQISADTTNILCCDGTNTIYGNAISPAPSPECFPISLPSNDIYFAPFNCMNFVRSEYGNNLDGSTPPSRIPVLISIIQTFSINNWLTIANKLYS